MQAHRRIGGYRFTPCRALVGHHWTWKLAAITVAGTVVTVPYTCATCGAVRKDRLRLEIGDLDGRGYVLPAGYRLKGPLAAGRRKLRAEWLAEVVARTRRKRAG